jgi:hypothetical protein
MKTLDEYRSEDFRKKLMKLIRSYGDAVLIVYMKQMEIGGFGVIIGTTKDVSACPEYIIDELISAKLERDSIMCEIDREIYLIFDNVNDDIRVSWENTQKDIAEIKKSLILSDKIRDKPFNI